MRAGPLLAETPLAKFRPLGTHGEPAYLAHARLAAALRGMGAEDCARYFARPELDGRAERISWYAEDAGPVRPWTSLSAEELALAGPRMLALSRRLTEICAARERANAHDTLARLLRSAAVSPGLEHLYLVGDRPVLTAWGFEAEGARFDTLAFALPPGPPIATRVPAAEARSWSWLLPWWWWLPLALGLLVALLWLLWAWWPAGSPVVTAETPAAADPGPTVEAPAERPAEAVGPPPTPGEPGADPRAGEVLTLPEEGVEFLEGTWRTDSRLVDRRDGKPLVQTFTFERNGWGETVTRRSDGVECRGRARAQRTAEGGLVIYGVEQAACTDGDAFVPFRLECAPGAGDASDCRGVNADDGSDYEVVVRRM